MTLREILLRAQSQAPDAFEKDHKVSAKPAVTAEYERWRNETFGIEEFSPAIEHQGCLSEAPLRRFMDLPKFLDLLTSRQLRLPQLAHLIEDDPFECNAKPDYSQVDPELLKQRVRCLKEYAPESFHKSFSELFLQERLLGQTGDYFEYTRGDW